MGNCLEYQPDQPPSMPPQSQSNMNSYRRTRPVIMPFSSFNVQPGDMEETDIKELPTELSVETTKLDTSGSTHMSISPGLRSPPSHLSSVTTGSDRRYIKRYRNEEEKLLDMLKERDVTLQAAIRQGQKLRAKCNRYKEELESLKNADNKDLTDSQWKRKYSELETRFRDLKEELDVKEARINNGRDLLKQKIETIKVLNEELEREQHKKLSTSMTSLVSVGKRDKNGTVSKLLLDNISLQDELHLMTERNKRGRDYLAQIEEENRSMRQQIESMQREKEFHLASQSMSDRGSEPDPLAVYAQVKKPHKPVSSHSLGSSHNTKEFEIDVSILGDPEDYTKETGQMYDEVLISDGVIMEGRTSTARSNTSPRSQESSSDGQPEVFESREIEEATRF